MVQLSFIDIGSGPIPVVLIMGLGASASAWEPHLVAWSAGRRCVAIDNRGTGSSPLGNKPATTRNMAEDVADLLDSLEIVQCDVVGISMGACIAQHLALDHSTRVRKLVLTAPWARANPYTASVLRCLAATRRQGTLRLFNEVLRNLVWTPAWINGHAAEMELALDGEVTMTADAFAQQVSACSTHNTMDALSHITQPTLVTYGTTDTFITPALSMAVADLIPGSRTAAFQDTGHVHHWERLNDFNRLVKEWLNE